MYPKIYKTMLMRWMSSRSYFISIDMAFLLSLFYFSVLSNLRKHGVYYLKNLGNLTFLGHFFYLEKSGNFHRILYWDSWNCKNFFFIFLYYIANNLSIGNHRVRICMWLDFAVDNLYCNSVNKRMKIYKHRKMLIKVFFHHFFKSNIRNMSCFFFFSFVIEWISLYL